ncbi:unnamed protein product [Boreogadus saida]
MRGARHPRPPKGQELRPGRSSSRVLHLPPKHQKSELQSTENVELGLKKHSPTKCRSSSPPHQAPSLSPSEGDQRQRGGAVEGSGSAVHRLFYGPGVEQGNLFQIKEHNGKGIDCALLVQSSSMTAQREEKPLCLSQHRGTDEGK